MKKEFIKKALLIGLCFFITSCTHNMDPNTYKAHEVGVAQGTSPGVVVSKRAVHIDGNSGVGGMVGAIAGVEAGSGLGGSGVGHLIGAVSGAVFGSVLGSHLDHKLNDLDGVEYLVRLRNGSHVTIVQTKNIQFAVNQRVLVIFGPKARLQADTRVITRNRALKSIKTMT